MVSVCKVAGGAVLTVTIFKGNAEFGLVDTWGQE